MPLTVSLFGCGTIGQTVAEAFADGTIGTDLVAVYDRNPEKCRTAVAAFVAADQPTIVDDVAALFEPVDLVIEAAGQGAVTELTVPALEAGCDVLLSSVGALADAALRERIIRTAEREGRVVHVPSGAIAGLDAVRTAALTGELESVSLTTTKPPHGLAGAPYLVENDVDLDSLESTEMIFEGPATEAATAFPSNINVAMALSLAGIGPEETHVRIVADPDEANNVHRIAATGGMGDIETTVRNVPSPMNPKTSYLAAISVIERFRQMDATVRVGT